MSDTQFSTYEPVMTHGAKIQWFTRNGWMALSVDGYSTRKEAIQDVYASAVRWGYQPPRWWEFRRRMVELNYPLIWHNELAP